MQLSKLSPDKTPDKKMGGVIQPDYPLTWERWAASGFDPNAEVILALELARKPRR